MRRLPLLLLTLTLAACQAGAGLPTPRTSKAPAKAASAKPSTSPSAAAKGATSPAPTLAPSAAPAALDVLAAPPGAAARLTGTLRVDAAYMVAAGAGNVLSHNGAQIVAAGGGNLVAAGAGNLVAAGAGNIVAAGAGNIVAAGAGNLVAAGAGNIVAAGGGNIVAAGGLNMVAAGAGNMVAAGAGNLVAAGAGNMVAAGAGNYALLDAAVPSPRFAIRQAAASPGPAITAGVQLPAAGMLLSIVSLATRTYLPMGVDAKGQPVYAVYSNAQGGYEAYVPPGDEKNVLIVANVPGRPDGRLIYNTFADRGAASARDVDEDTAIGARYLRRCFVSRLTDIILEPNSDRTIEIATNDPNLNDSAKALFTPMITRFRTLAAAKGIVPVPADRPATSDEKRVATAFAQEVVDATLSNMDLAGITINPLTAKAWTGPLDTPALQVFGSVMTRVREYAEGYMRDPADPSRYTHRIDRAFLIAANDAALGSVPPLRNPDRPIRKPTDVADFVIDEFLAVNRISIYRPIFTMMTRLQDDEARYAENLLENEKRVKELESAASSVVTEVIFALAKDPTSADADAAASRAAEKAARGFDAARAAAEDRSAAAN